MKITVAIPTIEGRETYLASCLRTCTGQDDDDLEILVSDNSVSRAARDVVEAIGDPRIRYVAPPRYLPMSSHWDFVLSQVTGDWLTFIGDDDGLMPDAIRRVRQIIADVGNIPIHHALCDYRWPDYVFPSTRNMVFFFHDIGGRHGFVESRQFLADIACAKADYKDGPMVYHNFVPVGLIRGLVEDGVFFRRSSPDVYSSIALAAHCPRYFSTDEVLTINGQGAKGNGAAFSAGVANQFIADMRAAQAPRFDSRVVQMHVLDSFLEVAEHFGRQDLLDEVRFDTNFAYALDHARFLPDRRVAMLGLLKLAHEHGVLFATVSKFFGNGLARLGRRAFAGPKPGGLRFKKGDHVLIHESVRDIFGAAHAMSKMLASDRAR